MKRHTGPFPQLSRRAMLRAAVVGVGLSAVPKWLHASTPNPKTITAIVFDGEVLLVTAPNLDLGDDDAPMKLLLSSDKDPILSLATHPDRTGRIFAGHTSGGVALSEDSGRTWELRATGLPTGAITALTIAASQPDMIYAAVKGDGLWQSEDAGLSWSFVMDRPWREDAEREVLSLASVDLATGMGGIWIYAGTETGLTRVPDCFCRWQDVQSGDAMDALVSGDTPPPEIPLPQGEAIQALVSAPSAPSTLYAALPSGVWTSRDAGVVWSRLIAGSASTVAVHPNQANDITAVLDGNLKRSRDGGVNWSLLGTVKRNSL